MAGSSRRVDRYNLNQVLSQLWDDGDDSDVDLDGNVSGVLNDSNADFDSDWEYSDNDNSDLEEELTTGRAGPSSGTGAGGRRRRVELSRTQVQNGKKQFISHNFDKKGHSTL